MGESGGIEGGEQRLELESFNRAARFLRSIMDIDELLHAILEEGVQAVRGTRGFIGLVNRATGYLEIRITTGQGWDEQPVRKFLITTEPGHGITTHVAATGEPYVSGDVRRDPHYLMFFPDVRSEITVPLVNRDGRTIGVINVESEVPNAFSQRDLQLLSALANQASIAHSVANYRAREAALIEIGNELASSTDMGELLQKVVQRTRELLRADDCSLFQLNPDGDRLVLRATGELMEHRIGELTYRLGEGLTGWVARHETPARVANVRDDPRWRGLYPALPSETVEAYLGAPVLVRRQLWGVLRVLRRQSGSSIVPNDFTERDEALLCTLARQVGAAITQQTLVDRQLQMERMAAWGEMSARSAHMIGNKVFAIKGQLNELEYLAGRPEFSPDQVRDVVQRAKNTVFSLEEILAEFRDFLLATNLNRKPIDLNELVATTVRENSPRGSLVPIHLDAVPELPTVSADPAKLKRALSELLENAVTHQQEGGEVRVVTGLWGPEQREAYPAVRAPAGGSGPLVRVEVLDRGPGVPEENKQRMFNPFFTTRAKGMGLGLSIVQGIIQAHGGTIAEVGRPGEGAHFVVVLPAVAGVIGH